MSSVSGEGNLQTKHDTEANTIFLLAELHKNAGESTLQVGTEVCSSDRADIACLSERR